MSARKKRLARLVWVTLALFASGCGGGGRIQPRTGTRTDASAGKVL
jgi:hypothetical protein